MSDVFEKPETTPGVSQAQRELMLKRMEQNPQRFQQMVIEESMQLIRETLKQGKLSAEFTDKLWQLLLADNELSVALQRYLWRIPLKQKRAFVQALDTHMSERYPMFKGLSVGWPGSNNIPPYVRPAEERRKDFDLVSQGYLGYMGLGYSLREVELFVWLEVIRDKQCEDRPCEIGVPKCDRDGNPAEENDGGCPVKIHIPQVLNLMGEGRFRDAFELIRDANPLPNVTGRVCPQELQCQGVCTHNDRPIEIGQLEWFLPQRERELSNGEPPKPADINPWVAATKPPVAIVGSGPSGLINAYLLAKEGYPVTVFEAFHVLGGVLRYGIPEFRLPNQLVDDVVEKIKALGGRFVTNYIVGKTATLEDLKRAGFTRIFVGTGAGLPRFMNVPGEHLLNIMSANEFLTRVNLMHANEPDYETPMPDMEGKEVMIIGGGNTAMDAARTACRLGANVTIVYRRTQQEMPARVEELHHALEEGIMLKELRSPCEFNGDKNHVLASAKLDVMALGEPDASGRRRPQSTGEFELMKVDFAIMALGNSSNPIVKDANPDLDTSKWGTLLLNKGSQETSLSGVYSGGDATRGGSTAIKAAGDGQAAAREIMGHLDFNAKEVEGLVAQACHYTGLSQTPPKIVKRRQLTEEIVEFTITSPLIARSAKAGQFVRVLADEKGELIPLTLADWDAEAGTIELVIQGLGTSSKLINQMQEGDCFEAIAGPLGQASHVVKHPDNQSVIFTAGGVGLPAVHPIMRAHLEIGNKVTLISGFRSKTHSFWTEEGDKVENLRAAFPGLLEVVYTSNDGTFGIEGFVTNPLEDRLVQHREANSPDSDQTIAEVITIGPPMMMRAVSDQTLGYQVPCVASLNSIMVDATGMCGACMVPVMEDGKLVRKHACIDGPEINSHVIDWDKFLPRFNQFKPQERQSQIAHRLIEE
ncbi:sulfide/dihydroorotate dehydrogenase-like FAD/NAD-binding protein [Photobacterium gaetbulicola]|uniref:Putative bifunctional glutamate synthase subunit beta/2-polyprenylphenol hydroxylase n=1 Tax=Photobacterium gaetbulicola Gung47 TaxID=658445 RepID=A0A0C5X1G7_9GAMM|nr:sulfide/dihydroorotate dehydrogenase-like FAD/NAD-binding protein [Photobacterium gaetbulicola]AJR09170.1 putative bifunctional glutamate synthase subunit beta/2-polyprenylphenol hydroxylase [Photobacterium gaetbulicola Gung47]PSU11777.1 sulfide/dihydroorotate dehydrogenase-like FAD/NAD-binding protein [Photobacterium gaetbulicola]